MGYEVSFWIQYADHNSIGGSVQARKQSKEVGKSAKGYTIASNSLYSLDEMLCTKENRDIWMAELRIGSGGNEESKKLRKTLLKRLSDVRNSLKVANGLLLLEVKGFLRRKQGERWNYTISNLARLTEGKLGVTINVSIGILTMRIMRHRKKTDWVGADVVEFSMMGELAPKNLIKMYPATVEQEVNPLYHWFVKAGGDSIAVPYSNNRTYMPLYTSLTIEKTQCKVFRSRDLCILVFLASRPDQKIPMLLDIQGLCQSLIVEDPKFSFWQSLFFLFVRCENHPRDEDLAVVLLLRPQNVNLGGIKKTIFWGSDE
ncbi:hypothetical protein Tco_0813458 [Tanacetum coccineum]